MMLTPQRMMPQTKFLGPMLLEAGQTHEFKFKLTEIDPPFRGKWIVTATRFASAFELAGLFINDKRQTAIEHPIPMSAFGEEAMGLQLDIGTARMGDVIKIVVKNVSDKDTLFCAVLMGDDGEEVPSSNVLGASATCASRPIKIGDATRVAIEREITKWHGKAATLDVVYVDEETREGRDHPFSRIDASIPIERIVDFVVGNVERDTEGRVAHHGSGTLLYAMCFNLINNTKNGIDRVERIPFIVGLVGNGTLSGDVSGPSGPYHVDSSPWLQHDPAARATIERYLRIHNLKESDVEVREFVIGYGPTMVPRGQTPTLLQAEPQVDLFIPRRLIVPASVGPSFEFHDVRVGKNSQRESPEPFPAADLDENAPIRDKNLGRGPAIVFKNAAKLGHKLSLSIRNVVPIEPNSKVNHDIFSAAIIGVGVEVKDNIIVEADEG